MAKSLLNDGHLTVDFDGSNYMRDIEREQYQSLKSLTATFKSHKSTETLEKITKILSSIIETGEQAVVKLNGLFTTKAVGSIFRAQNLHIVIDTQNEISKDFKPLGGYLHDGTKLLKSICETLSKSSAVKTVDFGTSVFYPNCANLLAELKKSQSIEKINFNNCTFFNFLPEFFVDVFANSNIDVDYLEAKLIDKGLNLGIPGEGEKLKFLGMVRLMDIDSSSSSEIIPEMVPLNIAGDINVDNTDVQ